MSIIKNYFYQNTKELKLDEKSKAFNYDGLIQNLNKKEEK